MDYREKKLCKEYEEACARVLCAKPLIAAVLKDILEECRPLSREEVEESIVYAEPFRGAEPFIFPYRKDESCVTVDVVLNLSGKMIRTILRVVL